MGQQVGSGVGGLGWEVWGGRSGAGQEVGFLILLTNSIASFLNPSLNYGLSVI